MNDVPVIGLLSAYAGAWTLHVDDVAAVAAAVVDAVVEAAGLLLDDDVKVVMLHLFDCQY